MKARRGRRRRKTKPKEGRRDVKSGRSKKTAEGKTLRQKVDRWQVQNGRAEAKQCLDFQPWLQVESVEVQ